MQGLQLKRRSQSVLWAQPLHEPAPRSHREHNCQACPHPADRICATRPIRNLCAWPRPNLPLFRDRMFSERRVPDAATTRCDSQRSFGCIRGHSGASAPRVRGMLGRACKLEGRPVDLAPEPGLLTVGSALSPGIRVLGPGWGMGGGFAGRRLLTLILLLSVFTYEHQGTGSCMLVLCTRVV